jgi:pyruvate dehydrogenase E2 component (dihydrolipoamide acetyltransferase)
VLIKVEAGGAAAAAPAPAAAPRPAPAAAAPVAAPAAAGGGVIEVKVPDIGDFSDVPVIDLFVKVGDSIKVDDAIATLESDKATMDVPSTVAGTVKEVLVQLGSKVSEGAVLIKVETGTASAPAAAVPRPSRCSCAGCCRVRFPPLPQHRPQPPPRPPSPRPCPSVPRSTPRRRSVPMPANSASICPRSPATGPKGRIVKEDLTKYVKGVMSGAISGPVASASGGVVGGGVLDLLPWPKVDFAKFGEVEVKPLSRIKKISGQNLSRNWVMIPAVTYHEDADITDLEAFRVQLNKENEKSGNKLTMLAFLIKACVKAMQRFPEFNASLDGDNLVLKKYFNIGFAADTPNGLVVPVIKNADKKGVFEIAKESGELAKQARDGKLKPADMSGACFTISSLGGIGGTYFAPIVNAPEVAILGVNKSAMKPVWDGKQFVPRLTLPLSLTADHRVIDGALATRFNVYVAELLADMRRMIV